MRRWSTSGSKRHGGVVGRGDMLRSLVGGLIVPNHRRQDLKMNIDEVYSMLY